MHERVAATHERPAEDRLDHVRVEDVRRQAQRRRGDDVEGVAQSQLDGEARVAEALAEAQPAAVGLAGQVGGRSWGRAPRDPHAERRLGVERGDAERVELGQAAGGRHRDHPMDVVPEGQAAARPEVGPGAHQVPEVGGGLPAVGLAGSAPALPKRKPTSAMWSAGVRTAISSSTLKPCGRRESRSSRSLRTRKKPLIGSVMPWSRRGKAKRAAPVASRETSGRVPCSPGASPSAP